MQGPEGVRHRRFVLIAMMPEEPVCLISPPPASAARKPVPVCAISRLVSGMQQPQLVPAFSFAPIAAKRARPGTMVSQIVLRPTPSRRRRSARVLARPSAEVPDSSMRRWSLPSASAANRSLTTFQSPASCAGPMNRQARCDRRQRTPRDNPAAEILVFGEVIPGQRTSARTATAARSALSANRIAVAAIDGDARGPPGMRGQASGLRDSAKTRNT